MNDQKSEKAAWQRLALAGGFDGRPPGGTGKRVAMAGPHGPQTLTEKFNAAAQGPPLSKVVSQPVSKVQMEALERKKSQPRLTLEYGTMGSVNNACNPQADRELAKTIKAMKEILAANKGLKQTFAKAQKKGQLGQSFNRSSKGRGI